MLEQIYRSMHCTPSDGWKGLDLTFQRLKVLASLFKGRQRIGKFAGLMDCIMSSATNKVDRQVDKGLVIGTIGQHDRLSVLYRPKDQRKETIEQFWSISRKRIINLADQLDTSKPTDGARAELVMNRPASVAFPAGYPGDNGCL